MTKEVTLTRRDLVIGIAALTTAARKAGFDSWIDVDTGFRCCVVPDALPSYRQSPGAGLGPTARTRALL
ncbi:hypothetical protein QFZ34_001451 [Phyllobacterium ifriqiyense]|uniref:Uncharacterized protein n=1 Tax=Phyllobacterium ifriqiyense TaxID=314238 RepID=A0ABU0S683_9HYPH|nr:hypothetical protein [Phyllobacterium ifriqiyense]MDQ0996274.1 hypothetical protein [Phyllobacterium ifriqiyense]